MISVVIRTIGRPTLKNAIKSALKEFDKVIVVADDVDLPLDDLPCDALYLKTGRKSDKYGSKAMWMGALACDTEYFCLLDDDDEFMLDAGEYMDAFARTHDYDVMIPGIAFNNGMVLCDSSDKGAVYGNVAVPTYRTSVFLTSPISTTYIQGNIPEDAIDFAHISFLKHTGSSVGWYGKVLYSIRPKLKGTNGRGI